MLIVSTMYLLNKLTKTMNNEEAVHKNVILAKAGGSLNINANSSILGSEFYSYSEKNDNKVTIKGRFIVVNKIPKKRKLSDLVDTLGRVV
ncbi:hypothetical protein HK099_006030 [Clydaea vesicula]|uniref:Uncharacterized protein n=1 Tax=Clydaea vesicula TaxID=447962 RepID=A0AAD5Y456_9FUNG|nr:hypothetical protein HK099_006030 [Clydaea vesicula]KAJ3397500.1 hypothetical protein HDU92_007163 [Lobulomyces angularis]